MAGRSRRLTGRSTVRPSGMFGPRISIGTWISWRVEAEPVVEDPVLAELLAVIRGDDDQGLAEHAPAFEFAEQLVESQVHRREAIVVGVAGQFHIMRSEGQLVTVPVFQEHPTVGGRPRPEPEPLPDTGRGQERLVRVEEVQEREERPPGVLTAVEPVEDARPIPWASRGLGPDPLGASESPGPARFSSSQRPGMVQARNSPGVSG